MSYGDIGTMMPAILMSAIICSAAAATALALLQAPEERPDYARMFCAALMVLPVVVDMEIR